VSGEQRYKIKISYQTGDSFHTEDCEQELEESWSNLDIAKENLKRIEEHDDWYSSKSSFRKKELDKPEWHKIDLSEFGLSSISEEDLINLKLDNGKEWQFWPFWIGYFETLYGAEIIIDNDDMSFSRR
jgi:hypothetical protein